MDKVAANTNGRTLKFIDLFAGLGGFHTGFATNEYECVFACELDANLRKLYHKNYGITPHDDIRTVDEKDIPKHDVLCAGFPCQPFSIAGKKKASKCPDSGKLIDDVVRIAKHCQPSFILLENVPNIITIAEGTFWSYIIKSFKKIGYNINYKIISPVDVGIPQNRKRVFIVASKNNTEKYNFDELNIQTENKKNLLDILDAGLAHKKLEDKKVELLRYWQKLLNNIDIENMPCKSIVAPEFGATYPLDLDNISFEEFKKHKGAYGADLSKCGNWNELWKLMPSYLRKNKKVPNWLKGSLKFTRELYLKNSDCCDMWAKELEKENNSWQILEWRGLRDCCDIYKHLVQFRASGIRIIKSEIAPSLISMTPTQIPVIPSENRYLSHLEAAKLQNLHNLSALPENSSKAFKALGNAVNAKIVGMIAENLKNKIVA